MRGACRAPPTPNLKLTIQTDSMQNSTFIYSYNEQLYLPNLLCNKKKDMLGQVLAFTKRYITTCSDAGYRSRLVTGSLYQS